MNVLSLFDGMSCGRIALSRAGIKVDKYYASELDKYAIDVTTANWPNTVQLGDITLWREWSIDWSSIDLLIGGSPCQGFSFAGKQLAFDDSRSKLFFVYVDILNHIKSVNPNMKFLLENVKMKKEYLDIISEHVGVQPVLINSALVSAQNRQRYYWASWEFEEPEDKKINVDNILQYENKQPNGEGWQKWWRKNHVFQISKNYSAVMDWREKAICMTARQVSSWNGNLKVTNKGLRFLTPIEGERLQTVPDNYTSCVSDSQRYKILGNGWTIDVIAHIFKQLQPVVSFL